MKTVMVDFDKTICPNAFPDFVAPYPQAKYMLEKLRQADLEVCIYSCRTSANVVGFVESGRQEGLLKEYMRKYQLPYARIIMDKPVAIAYIDDRAYRAENGENLIEITKKIISELT